MTRVVLVGATGTVGRELTGLLSRREGVDLVAVGRDRVRLEHLQQSLGVQTLSWDSSSQPASALPEADVLVDLTFSLNRHPRWVVHTAERGVEVLLDYLRLHPAARIVHTGTFALLNPRPDLAGELSDRLEWSGTYLLSKSATERALRRAGPLDRLAVLRLGNMAVPDMVWSTSILKAVRDGAVATPAALARPANLADARQLADALLEPLPPLSHLAGMAGFTWAEVIGAVAQATGQPPLDTPVPQDGGGQPSGSRLGPVVRRALYPAPLATARGPLEALPGARRWLTAGRRLVRREKAGAIAFPAPLPLDRPMPGAGRDEARLGALVGELAGLFETRGWRPL